MYGEVEAIPIMLFQKPIFWPFKVNAAIAAIGISPNALNHQRRYEVQELGLKAGLTPQETALVLVSLLVGARAPTVLELIVSIWHRDGNVDFEKPEVIDALYDIGCSVGDPYWEYDAIDIFGGISDENDIEQFEEYAKTPIAQLFARSRWNKFQIAAEPSKR